MTTKTPNARPAQDVKSLSNDNELKPQDDGWKNASDAQKIEVL